MFFSSLAVANDDLSGKSIVCGMSSDDLCALHKDEDCSFIFKSNQEIIIAIEFKDANQGSWHDYKGKFFYQDENNPEVPFLYKTDLQAIALYFFEDNIGDIDLVPTFKIDRKSLSILYNESEFLNIGEQCVVYDNYEDINESIIKMKDKIIAEITKDNKI